MQKKPPFTVRVKLACDHTILRKGAVDDVVPAERVEVFCPDCRNIQQTISIESMRKPAPAQEPAPEPAEQ